MKITSTVKDKIYSNKGNPAVINEIHGEKLIILDVGCGAGDNVKIFSNLGHVSDGITFSEEEARISRQFMRNVFIYNLEFGLPEGMNEKYHYVICSHVIEHIAYPDKLLTDIRRVLNANGKLIVALPNIMHYKSRWKLIKGEFDYEDSGIWDNTHLRWYTFQSGKDLLQRNGFVIEKQFVEGAIPLYRITKVLPVPIQNIIMKGLCFISKGLFGRQLIYVARPKTLLEN